MAKKKQPRRRRNRRPDVEAPAQSKAEEPETSIAQYPGNRVDQPRILWVGTGDLFRRVFSAGVFEELLERGAQLTFIDVKPKEEVNPANFHSDPSRSKELEIAWENLMRRTVYYNVSVAEERKSLIYDRKTDSSRVFTHCYVANWPEAHLLSAVKYSGLCHGGDIIITKPLDLNVLMVEAIEAGVFPDISDKIFVDDHYRNKGSIRALHGILPNLQMKEAEGYGKLQSFRIWLIEPTTIEDEGRLKALECGVIWDLATHLVSLIRLFFLDEPYQGLVAYGQTLADPPKDLYEQDVDVVKDARGSPVHIRDVGMEVRKVMRMRYRGCELSSPDAETLAVIEIAINFKHGTYKGWLSASVPGLLVVGKGAVREVGAQQPVKQLDLSFETGYVNLNYAENRMVPPFDQFDHTKTDETGFGRSVVELLTHSRRQSMTSGSGEPPPPGRYSCSMTFRESYDNTIQINEFRSHASAQRLHKSYQEYEPIRKILDRLVGKGYLQNRWLDPNEYGEFV